MQFGLCFTNSEMNTKLAIEWTVQLFRKHTDTPMEDCVLLSYNVSKLFGYDAIIIAIGEYEQDITFLLDWLESFTKVLEHGSGYMGFSDFVNKVEQEVERFFTVFDVFKGVRIYDSANTSLHELQKEMLAHQLQF